ncbi:MAG: HlyD family efflux transporter periplasmic adaptor subunit [Planctomycetia bacterium]|nr:HlyD family efflux transporter periplasmic adaptor subunit [Planctomycetia bacterium]
MSSQTEAGMSERVDAAVRRAYDAILADLAALVRQGDASVDVASIVLDRVISFSGAAAGAIWLRRPDGPLQLHRGVKVAETGVLAGETQASHEALLARVVERGQACVVLPGPHEDNPTAALLLIAALRGESGAIGLFEVFHSAPLAQSAQRGLMRLMEEAGQIAASAIARPASLPAAEAGWAKDIEAFSRSVHSGLDLAATSFQIANEGRRVLACDRLSVAVARRKKCRLAAISGQEQFDRRSNAVRRLEGLAAAVLKGREPFWFDGESRELAPELEKAVHEYVDETFVKVVGILPLFPPAPTDEAARPAPIGALVVEQIETSRLDPARREAIEPLCHHSAAALANALRYEGLFLLPVWRTLGRAKAWVMGKGRRTAAAIAFALVTLIAALCIIPADFDLEARGQLQPVGRQDVFAQEPGVVQAVLVAHGDVVNPGQRLAEMRSLELDVAHTELRGQLSSASEELSAVEAALLARGRLEPAEREQLQGRKRQLAEKVQSLKEQLALVERRRELLVVTSPIRGQVTTLDVKNRLLQRPVERGQLLVSVADTDGEWELELYVPEDRIGHVMEAQQAAGGEPLEVRFVAANDPGTWLTGKIKEMHHRAEMHGEEGQSVAIKVAVEKRSIRHLRAGSTVVGRVHCGRRAVGYVWTHQVYEFIQRNILFRL